MWNLKKGYKWTYLQNRNRVTDVENKLMVTQGWGRGGMNWETGMDTYTLQQPFSPLVSSVMTRYASTEPDRVFSSGIELWALWQVWCSLTTLLKGHFYLDSSLFSPEGGQSLCPGCSKSNAANCISCILPPSLTASSLVLFCFVFA